VDDNTSEIRTKASVAEGVSKLVRKTLEAIHVNYQPGNGTAYDMMLIPLVGLEVSGTYSSNESADNRGAGYWLLSFINCSGKAYPITAEAHWSYLAAKFDLGEVDAKAVWEALRFILLGENVVGKPEVR
jgi:hypothetical protein